MNRGKGILYCILSQIIWGVMPVYWKAIHFVNAFALIAHRVLWSFVFMMLLLSLLRRLPDFRSRLRETDQLRYSLPAAALIVFNWFIYVYAIQKGFILQTALGYYICPLFLALVSWTYYKEKPRRAQLVAAALTTVGVALQIRAIGSFPYYAFLVSLSFAFYSLVKKQTPYNSLYSMGYETLFLLPLSLIVLGFARAGGWELSAPVGAGLYWVLLFAGPLTVLPLLLHSFGVRSAPLSLVAFLQYLSPTISMVLGVLFYNESFDGPRLIAFAFSWAAILLFAGNQWMQTKQKRQND